MARRSPEDDPVLQDLVHQFPIIKLLEDRSDSLLEETGEDHYQFYYRVGQDDLAAPVATLEINRANLEGAIALERRLIGDERRDVDSGLPERIASRAVLLMYQFANEEAMSEGTDEDFFAWIEASGEELFGTPWFESRLLRWLETKDATKLERLRKALSKLAQIRRGPKPRGVTQKAVNDARKLWPKVEKAARTFARDWREAADHEYKTAARQELVEHFLKRKSSDIKDRCLKRISDRKLGLKMRTAVLVSAATGLSLAAVRRHVQPTTTT